ncbi:MAG: helix-turn-helix domain-containing protein [Planctomycetes bacterium]|nr:helix-turn-helix domain-containing protein [Planctomycetota bacterium]
MAQRCLFIKLSREELFALNKFISDMAVKSKFRARLRGQVAWLSHQNRTPEYIARYFHCPIKSVYKWLRLYRRKGLDGLRYNARKPKLSAEEIAKAMAVSHWADSTNNDKEYRARWTFRRIAGWIKENTGTAISHERIRQIIYKRLKE